jgi:hypothetical protein
MVRSSACNWNKAAIICYDAFLAGAAGYDRNKLCCGCTNYLDEPVKKVRSVMGHRFQCKEMRPEGYKLPAIFQDRSTEMNKRPSKASISSDNSKESLTIISTSRTHRSSKPDQAMKEVQFLKRRLKDEQSKVRVLEEKNARLQEQVAIAKSSKALSNAHFDARETSFR